MCKYITIDKYGNKVVSEANFTIADDARPFGVNETGIRRSELIDVRGENPNSYTTPHRLMWKTI